MEVRGHKSARAAFAAVSARKDDPNKKQYGALAHKLPGLILQNGLAQATGFLMAKDKAEHRALLDDLRAVLQAAGVTTAPDRARLHQSIIDADMAGTMMLTRHALDASGWIKRYVQGELRLTATGETAREEGADGH